MDATTGEIIYNMNWNQNAPTSSTFIYFDNCLSEELVNKYYKLSNVQFYNINTDKYKSNNIFNVDISNSLKKKNGNMYVSDYIDIRNKLNSIIKNQKIVLYFDCNNDYSYLYNVIKDVVRVKNIDFKIIMHKPFSVEGGKKTRLYEDVKKNFKEYDIIDVDYEAIGKDKNVSFKDAFNRRDEELIKLICR